MRSTLKHLPVGRAGALAAAILLVGGCTQAGTDVRSAAPTGSLNPAVSASAAASASTSAGGYGAYGGDYPSGESPSAAAPSTPAPSTAARITPAPATAAPPTHAPVPTVHPTATPSHPAPTASTQGQTVNVASGAVGYYLTGRNGHTLYTFAGDTANTSTCSGSCAQTWPPFVVGTSDGVTAGSGVTGKLTTFARSDGKLQVAHNGMPLYYNASDTKAGDTNGDGAGGAWYVAAP